MAATTVNAGDPGFSQACADATGKQSFHGYQCSNGMLFCYLEGSLGGVVNVQADDAYKQDFLKLGGAIAASDSCCGDCETIGCDANSGLYKISGCFFNSGGKPDPFVGGQVGPFSDCWDELIANQVSFDTGPSAEVNFVSNQYVVGNPVGVHQIGMFFAGDRGSNC
jgi:hypothetical protein